LQKIEDYINNAKAETAYFSPTNGNRTMFFVVNMDTSDMIPMVLEPLSQEFKAKVEVRPLMNLDDLKKAFSKLR
jgi:RNA polymerase-interacting CarD/CdnL/TRCF family regulator